MRRPLLTVLVAGLLLASAGCLGTPAGDGPDGQPTPTTEPEPTAPESTDAAPTTEWQTGVAPGDRLLFTAMGNLTATVRQYPYEDGNRTLQASQTLTMTAGDRATVTAFDPAGTIVVSIDGEPAWNGTVGSADHYEIALSPDGTATVTRHVVS